MPNIDGPQQLRFLAGFPPGEYTLILRRFDDGAGVLLVRDADGATRRIPIDRDVTTELRLLVRVTREAGAITIDVLTADARPAPTDVRETLPTPRPTATDRPREAATATLTATRPPDLAAMREQYVLAIRAQYLAQLGNALLGGDAPALTTALRAATEGDATVVRLLVLGEQLRNRNVQLRIIQLLGQRPTLALSLWLDEGGDNLEALRAAVLTTLARVEGDRDDSGSGLVPSDRPAEGGVIAETTDVAKAETTGAVAIDSVQRSDER
jgi:hypothetical protein